MAALTELEIKVLCVLVGLAGNRPEYVKLATLVEALGLPEVEVNHQLVTLHHAMLVWHQNKEGHKWVQPDINAVSLVRRLQIPPTPRSRQVRTFIVENLKIGLALGIQNLVSGTLGFFIGLIVGQRACS